MGKRLLGHGLGPTRPWSELAVEEGPWLLRQRGGGRADDGDQDHSCGECVPVCRPPAEG